MDRMDDRQSGHKVPLSVCVWWTQIRGGSVAMQARRGSATS